MWRIVMRQHSPLAACLYDIQHCLYQWSLMIFAFISGWKVFFDCFPLFVCQITFVICCLIFFFHISYYTTFLLWTQALNILKLANVKTQVKNCLSPKGIMQFRCFSGVSASFNWKMVSSLSVLRPVFCGRQPSCHYSSREIWTGTGWDDPEKIGRERIQWQQSVFLQNHMLLLRRILWCKGMAFRQ